MALMHCKHMIDTRGCNHEGWRHATCYEEIAEVPKGVKLADMDGDEIATIVGDSPATDQIKVRLLNYGDEVFTTAYGRILVPGDLGPTNQEERDAIRSILGHDSDLVTIDLNDQQALNVLSTLFAAQDRKLTLPEKMKKALGLFRDGPPDGR